MRVLVVHNRYSSLAPSGENLAVDDEVAFLRQAGVDVHVHHATNDDALAAGPARRIQQAISAPWSLPEQRRLRQALDAVSPDVVHVHNLFPLLTASVPAAALQRRLPVVWTVHNRRALCIAGTHLRDGQPCHDCRPGWRVAGIRHRCYRDSLSASVLVTGATATFRGIVRRRITAIAVSQDVQNWLIEAARIPAERVVVKYNGVRGPDPASPPGPAEQSRVFLFAGKLDPHKGVHLMLDAWARAGLPDAELRIVGDGPCADDVRAAAERDPRITFVGQVTGDAMAGHYADARVVIVPSICAEAFPRVGAEALAHGRPVISTGLGGTREAVGDGAGWMTGVDPASMAAAIVEAGDDSIIARCAATGRERHRRLFSPEATTRTLLDIYTNVIG